jgi:hypothetical protein
LSDVQQGVRERQDAAEADREARYVATNRVEQVLSEVRAATVVFEATLDFAAVEQVSELLKNCIEALKYSVSGLDDLDSHDPDADSSGSSRCVLRRLQRTLDVKRLTKEVD